MMMKRTVSNWSQRSLRKVSVTMNKTNGNETSVTGKRPNTIKDIVSVVVTVVIVYTITPLPLIPSSVYNAYDTIFGGAEYTSEEGDVVFLSDAEVLLRSSAAVGFARPALAGAAVVGSARSVSAWRGAAVGLARAASEESAALFAGRVLHRERV